MGIYSKEEKFDFLDGPGSIAISADKTRLEQILKAHMQSLSLSTASIPSVNGTDIAMALRAMAVRFEEKDAAEGKNKAVIPAINVAEELKSTMEIVKNEIISGFASLSDMLKPCFRVEAPETPAAVEVETKTESKKEGK